MAMSKTLKFVLIGGAAAFGVYYISRRFTSEPAKPTVASSGAQIVGGIKDLYGALTKKPPTGTMPDNSPYSTTPVSSADGDSAISNSSGLDRATQYQTMPGTPDFESRATTGDIRGSFYTTDPLASRIRA